MSRMLVNDIEVIFKFHQPVRIKKLPDQLMPAPGFRSQKLFLEKFQLSGFFHLGRFGLRLFSARFLRFRPFRFRLIFTYSALGRIHKATLKQLLFFLCESLCLVRCLLPKHGRTRILL